MASDKYDVVVVGAGFTGLTAAYVLSKQGFRVRMIESDTTPGGLAGFFELADGVKLDKFYHHLFNSDEFVPDLAKDLGMKDELITLPSRTGMYLGGRLWKLSTPMDLFRFTPLSLVDRIRLGSLVFRVRQIKEWRTIEHLSIREWLEPLCGKNVYRVVWEPLVASKFSAYAEAVNAVWMWKKLVLRGSTRDKKGSEELVYFKGGFGRLAEAIVLEVQRLGGDVRFGERATGVQAEGNRLLSLHTNRSDVAGRHFLFTPALPVIADIFNGTAHPDWHASLSRIHYLGNICLVLRLKHALSDIYWLNVNDPGFPFVGVIEHTNFDKPESYKDTHIVFLSRYLSAEDPVWSYNDDQYYEFALKHLKRMFPKIDSPSVLEYRVWRGKYAQPVTERGYSRHIPAIETPFSNASIATMAQIYPEDRGINYAIRDGRAVAARISHLLSK